MVFQASSGVHFCASAMAMVSRFAATRAVSTAVFCAAKVMDVGVLGTIAVSTSPTTRILLMSGLIAMEPEAGHAARAGRARSKTSPAAPAPVSLKKSRRLCIPSSFHQRVR